MKDVLAIGEILIDFATESVDGDGYPTMAAHAGGAPANFLAALAKYGHSTGMIGKVGSDAFGRMLIGTLNKSNIGTDGVIVDEDVFTTLAFVTFDENGDRSFSFARKPGADTCLRETELDFEMLGQAKVLHFGTLSLTDEPAISATKAAVKYARSKGVMISFDPNLRKPLWKSLDDAKEAMLWGLEQSDVVKISDDEVEFLFGMTPEEGLEFIFEKYPVKLLYITCGAEGSWFKTAEASGFVPAMKGLDVIDTTGAGDIYGGSAMHMFLRKGKSPEALNEDDLKEIVSFATTAAGLSTTAKGGIPSIPSEKDVIKNLNA